MQVDIKMDMHIGSKDGPQASSAKVVDQMAAQVRCEQEQWLATLMAEPQRLAEVEQQVHLACSRQADQRVAALLAQAGDSPAMRVCEKRSWLERRKSFVARNGGR